VEHEHIEPLVSVLQRPLKLNGLRLEGQVKPLVLDVADPVKREPGLAPLEQNRGHLYLLDVLDLPEVVEVVVDAGLVQTRKHVQARRVVVVAVDAEDRQLYG